MWAVFHVGCSHMQDMETNVNTETGVALNTAKEYVLAEKVNTVRRNQKHEV